MLVQYSMYIWYRPTAFNLINDVDVEETEATIKKFRDENQDLIAQNAVHEARQGELAKRKEEALKREREERKAELMRLEEEARREERELKDETINSLVSHAEVFFLIPFYQYLSLRFFRIQAALIEFLVIDVSSDGLTDWLD